MSTISTILHPGVYYETPEQRGKKSIESLVRAEMRRNGYPTTSCYDTPCTQPDICDKLTGCTLPGGAVCALNGILGTGLEGDCISLGGDLTQDTVITSLTFDFSLVKDNVKLDINDAGGTLGAGETARFIGTNGTVTAETGVYTAGGGTPSTGSRLANSSTNFYAIQAFDPTLERYILNAGLTTNAYNTTLVLDKDTVTLGLVGSSTTTLVIDKFNFTGGTDIVKLVGLPVFANNAAATGAGLTADCVYKTVTGELRIVV